MQRNSIRILDGGTIAQIAAGEVIERPVSVVKELVENSLDAAARRITVELADGGCTTIAVIDDGVGIERASIPLAPARHATSKLQSAEDLFAISSLGFRGEGLASIAAAADVELTSRTVDADVGARVEARGTWIGDVTLVAAPVGTKVVVRDLFSRTPARRRFLKSARAEFSRAAAFLSQIALGWPRVTFVLRHDGKTVWSLPAVEDPRERLELVFGRDARGALLGVAASADAAHAKVRGYVSAPGRDRPNRNGQVFFVNGRIVRSAALAAAWSNAYGSFGMTGRYPFGVLILQLPNDSIDVNVHPTKTEVRFAQPEAVFQDVRAAVARTLRGSDPAAVAGALGIARASAAPSGSAPQISLASGGNGSMLFAPTPMPQAHPQVIGQIDRSFIAVANDAEIVVIDQHAAHERIAYEAIVAANGERDAGAALLFPALVELTPRAVAMLHEFEGALAAVGVTVEPFGDGAYRITSLPAGYEKRHFDLAAVLDDLSSDDAPREGVAHRNRVLATIACHCAVRAGDALSPAEQLALYERLMQCREPHTCPHGRPTMLRLDGAALWKVFKRA